MKKISTDLSPVSKNANASTEISFTSPNPKPPALLNALLSRYSAVKIAKKLMPEIGSIYAFGSRTEKITRRAKK
jgi:hypothetical protein